MSNTNRRHVLEGEGSIRMSARSDGCVTCVGALTPFPYNPLRKQLEFSLSNSSNLEEALEETGNP